MTSEVLIPAILILMILFFSALAALGMGWSLKTGQFENHERNAEMIFDADEPIGQTTDRFPG